MSTVWAYGLSIKMHLSFDKIISINRLDISTRCNQLCTFVPPKIMDVIIFSINDMLISPKIWNIFHIQILLQDCWNSGIKGRCLTLRLR